MKKTIVLLTVLLLGIGAQAQDKKPRYYVAYTTCYCDPEHSSISSEAKKGYHLFISNVEMDYQSTNPTSSDNIINEDKIKKRFRDQVKIEFDNWTELTNIFVEDFASQTEAADYRREKMANEKSRNKSQIHNLIF